MRTKFGLFVSIFEIAIGALSIAMFTVLLINGEDVMRWALSLLLAVMLVINGIVSICLGKKSAKSGEEEEIFSDTPKEK